MPQTTQPCTCGEHNEATDKLIGKIGFYYTAAAVLAIVMIGYFLHRYNKA